MADLLLPGIVIFGVLLGWIGVERWYRHFATVHPELGPYRPPSGCDGGCSCGNGSCPTESRAPGPDVSCGMPSTTAHQKILRRQEHE